ncbi:VOC family protein [Nitrospirillum viridazoti]|uniref:PhnB protein n=1 Tax=Nitrospirillum amazonense TaxID=28077 RepID=A0A560HWW6_9PROT|nr:VOC family protein [Nitrospirillum amazonense]TWB51147.1 PhnB protein [Nitrospirillum amazonense]
MTEPNPRHPLPHLTVDNAAAAIDFYTRAFGATEASRHLTPDGRVLHASLVFPDGGVLMLNDDFPEYAGGRSRSPKAVGICSITLHITVADVDAAWEKAVAAGATIAMPLADQFWGDRYGKLTDPFGQDWSLSSPRRKPSAEEMAEVTAQMFPAKG